MISPDRFEAANRTRWAARVETALCALSTLANGAIFIGLSLQSDEKVLVEGGLFAFTLAMSTAVVGNGRRHQRLLDPFIPNNQPEVQPFKNSVNEAVYRKYRRFVRRSPF